MLDFTIWPDVILSRKNSQNAAMGWVVLNRMFQVNSYTCAGPQPGFIKPEETVQNYVLLGVEAGTFDYGVGEMSGRASFGDLVVSPPGTVFRRRSLGEISFHVFQFTALAGSDDTLPEPPAGKVSIGDVNRLSSTYSYLRKSWHEYGGASGMTHFTGHMLMDLLYMCEQERKNTLNRKKTTDPLMQQAAGYIHRHLFGEISMRHIAAQLGIKPSELSRRFRLAYGCVPVEYATRLRLEEAKRLLRETNDTLEAIASRCGYENGAYLCRVFRAKIGITPSAFRNDHQI
jgi:AraC-like DNA-binding protein